MNELGKTNGQEHLPDDYEAVVRSAVKQNHDVITERDEFKKQVWQLKSDIAAHKVAAEASAAIMNDNESRMQSAFLMRDQKIAEAEKWKTICTLIAAVLREHDIESAPVIKDSE